MKSIKQILDEKKAGDKNKYVTREYQDYGYRLAAELGDLAHKSLYIKLAKTVDRSLLEQCRRFVLDSNADNKGALFMWKLKELKSSQPKDFVDFAGSVKPIKGRDVLKAREHMEKHYKRV